MNATGLTLEGCAIGSWTDGGGESGAAEDLGYIYDSNTNTYTVYNADGLLAWNKACLLYTSQDVYQQALKYSHELGYIILALAVVIVASVSYTHLDVYKRQTQTRLYL